MSRAFVREGDVPDAPESPAEASAGKAHFVTPAGLRTLAARVRDLEAERDALRAAGGLDAEGELRRNARALRTAERRLAAAVVIDPAGADHPEVRFGATVTLLDDAGHRHRFSLVDETESCAARGWIAVGSPLGRALLGRRPGDVVVWERPAGLVELELETLAYLPLDDAPT